MPMTEAGKTTVTERSEKTLSHHLKAFGTGDLEAIMVDYAEDVLLITPEEIFKGAGQVRSFFTQLFARIFPEGWSALQLEKQVVEGEVAYIIWSGASAHLNVPFATDTFIIREGKITAQTFAARLPAASNS
jgi:ketosteroid isomerase-like protein